jgi:hypothetical protein
MTSGRLTAEAAERRKRGNRAERLAEGLLALCPWLSLMDGGWPLDAEMIGAIVANPKAYQKWNEEKHDACQEGKEDDVPWFTDWLKQREG